MKRFAAAVLVLLLLLGCMAGCAEKKAVSTTLPETDGHYLTAAVLYDSACAGGAWEDTVSHLTQPLVLGLETICADVSAGFTLEGVDVLYPDESLLHSERADEVRRAIVEFADNGGAVFLTNGFYDFFETDFIGAKEFVKLEAYPGALDYPNVGEDLGELQGIVADFAALYPQYTDFARLSVCDYGWAVRTEQAKALVKCGKDALYTMNAYGKGLVFFTSRLLPNVFSINGFSMESRSQAQESFASTTAGCNQLLENAFVSYVSKCRYGFSLWRVFGSFGRPNMSWELHYEEITGFRNNSAGLFTAMCAEEGQIPSFTIIRNTYWWFLRTESVTYLLDAASQGEADFAMDLYENAYSSGTHVAAGNVWLSQASIENAGSYFVDYPEYDYRACPVVLDYDGDGDMDLFCGSADGKLYYYDGRGYSDRLHTAEAVPVLDETGEDLFFAAGYTAPEVCDYNGDGVFDLLIGTGDGKVYAYTGNGTLRFAEAGCFLQEESGAQALPCVGDLNGDEKPDLALGSDSGALCIFWGEEKNGLRVSKANSTDLTTTVQDAGLGTFLAPTVYDYDSDGSPDLLVGTFDGYVARLHSDGESFSFDGYVDCSERNYKGNNHVKFGSYCVPRFADVDGDGRDDLICGSLEYGLAYPIDSEYFPYRDALQAQIDVMRENHFYAGVHFYTNEYASPGREAYELAAHKAALESYGLDLTVSGTNQHTWWTSTNSPAQSFESIWDAEILWDSGFTPAGSRLVPQTAAENVISLPFFLERNGEKTLLVQNNSTLLYADENWPAVSARYGMPICVYYHCDFAYSSPDTARTSVQTLAAFQAAHNYNFVREDQLMRASAAAMNLTVTLSSDASEEAGYSLTLTPGVRETDFALYDADYAASCGVRVSFGEAYDAADFTTDADVWYRDGNNLYVGANRAVTLSRTGTAQSGAHLERVNVAARISCGEAGAVVGFLDDGMLQAAVAGEASTPDVGWTVEFTDGVTTFTKYGGADTLHIEY